MKQVRLKPACLATERRARILILWISTENSTINSTISTINNDDIRLEALDNFWVEIEVSEYSG